jgi:hypothetical protein
MNRLFSSSLLASTLILSPLVAGAAASGEVDFGTFKPAATGEFVEVDMNAALLSFAARIAATQEPEAAELLKGIQRVRVNVVALDDANRVETSERVQRIRQDLRQSGWSPVVTAKANSGEDVMVLVKLTEAGALDGIVVTVLERTKQAVLVNVVGNVDPDKLADLGRRLNIDVLKRAQVAAKP